MPFAAFIPLIAAAVAAGASALQARAARKTARENNRSAMELSKFQYSKELEMWNKQNEYNAPKNQMFRFGEAGLNPNLIYGQGNSGNASSMPHYNAPTLRHNFEPMVDLPAMLSAYQDFSMKQAQIDNVKANTEKTAVDTYSRNWDLSNMKPYQSEVAQEKARRASTETQISIQKLRNMTADERQKELNIMRSGKSLELMDIESEKKAAELLFQQYKNEWMKEGVTTSDNPILRIMVRMMVQSGISPGEFLKENATRFIPNYQNIGR